MGSQIKEWAINLVLLAGIIMFIFLIGRNRFSPSDIENMGTSQGSTGKNDGPGNETEYGPTTATGDSFEALGTLNIFRDLVTPTPTAPPRTPTPAPTPNLADVVGKWEFAYPIRSRNQFVFTEGKEEIVLEEGVSKNIRDPKTKQFVPVTARAKGRYGVIVEGAGQSKEFSLR
ncbi:MAG: hypothetical protein ACLFUS_02105 [Candidatus Sumerlaeia bacterium]